MRANLRGIVLQTREKTDVRVNMNEANSLHQNGKEPTILDRWDILAFGFGNIQNDMCGSMVLGYLLVYCTMVLELSNESATIIVMACQIADGLSTILVGYLVTQTKQCWFSKKYGNLKSWHLLGTFLVASTFPLIFRKSVFQDHSTASEPELVIYYSITSTLYAFGWAISQISHLSMITAKSSFKMDWYSLTSIRNMGTVHANLVVTTLFAIFLSKEKKVLPVDDINFEVVGLCVLCIGVLASFTFQFYFKLDDRGYEIISDIIKDHPEKNCEIKEKSQCSWLRQLVKISRIATTFMISRLFYTTAQTFVPLYVEYTLNKSAVNIAIIQSLMYLGGILTSCSSQRLINKFGIEKLLVCGSFLGNAMAAWIFVGVDQTFRKYEAYVMVIILGVVQSLFQICCLAKIAEKAADSSNSSSFLYGFMSFSEKLLCGMSVYFFEKLAPHSHGPYEKDFYRVMIAVVFSVTSTLLGTISALECIWTCLYSKRTNPEL